MKNKFSYFIAILTIVGLVSCNIHDKVKVKSYVHYFYEFERITAVQTDTFNFTYVYANLYDSEFKQADKKYKNFASSREYREEVYNKYCSFYGDLNFNEVIALTPECGMVSPIPGIYPAFTATWPQVVKIEVFTQENYDSDHPANSSIADITRYKSLSRYEFIQAGYVSADSMIAFSFGYDMEYTQAAPPYSIKDRNLDDISETDLYLMGGVWHEMFRWNNTHIPTPDLRNETHSYSDIKEGNNYEYCLFALEFTSAPAEPGTYPILIRLTHHDGSIKECVYKMKYNN